MTITLKRQLPSIGYLDLGEAGGLIAYGVDFPQTFRRAVVLVDKMEQSQAICLSNSPTALGLTIPPSLLPRADEVIE